MRARTAILWLLALFALYCVVALWFMRKGARLVPDPGTGRPEVPAADSRPVLVAPPGGGPTRTEAPPVAPGATSGSSGNGREAESAERVALTVVDVGSGKPVPGVSIGWPSSRAAETAGEVTTDSVSDAVGIVEVPRSEVTRLVAMTRDWIIVRRTAVEVLTDARLHVSRKLSVTVVVSAAPGSTDRLAMNQVHVALAPKGPDPLAESGKEPPRYSAAWLRKQRREEGATGTPDADGRLTLATEWSRGWTLKARAPGWRAVSVDVPEPAPDSQVDDVHLVLRPIPRMKSQVLDAQGRPLPEARVALHVKRVFPTWEEAERASAEAPEGAGRQLMSVKGQDRTVLTFLVIAGVDREDGRFELDLDFVLDGHALLVTRAPGLLTEVRQLRPESDDLEAPIRLAGPARPDERIPITRGGVRLKLAEILVNDVTDLELQISHKLPLENGTVLAEALVRDRYYVFHLESFEARFLRWDGRVAIELDDLERDLDRFFASRR